MSEVEETVKRLQSQKGVIGVLVTDIEGRAIRSTMNNEMTNQYAVLLHQMANKARSSLREIDATNDLTFLRMRSKKHEILIVPDKDYCLAVIQNPNE